MKAKIVNGVKFKSRSELARELLEYSDLTDAEIAREVGMTSQTVFAVKKKMMKAYGLI